MWIASLAPLVFVAHRISRPIQQLTAGLTDFAGGDWDRRVDTRRDDEVGRAIEAFNHMAAQLRRRPRAARVPHADVQLAAARAQDRARAEELPDADSADGRGDGGTAAATDRAFVEQAAQIVIAEIETLERRVRAFSEFAASRRSNPTAGSVNAVVQERVSLLKAGAPRHHVCEPLDPGEPRVHADADLVKGILTNLLENAAEAAGPGGTVAVATRGLGTK